MRPLPILASALCVLLSSCSGTHSTITEGFAYRMNEAQASEIVQSVIRANIVSDRIHPMMGLTASGYDRSLVDTQTYTVTAIPAPRLAAFGFEVAHQGTMHNGPSKARRMYESVKQRASLVGEKVSVQ
jgi:hypothetical protein